MKTILLVCASAYVLCGVAYAQGYPAGQARTDVASAVNGQPANSMAAQQPAPPSPNGVPSYLLRQDGTLINGLRPARPDEQG
jgi:hypothetical protein